MYPHRYKTTKAPARVWVRACVRAWVCECACVRACVHAWVHVCVCTCVRVCASARVRACVRVVFVYVCMLCFCFLVFRDSREDEQDRLMCTSSQNKVPIIHSTRSHLSKWRRSHESEDGLELTYIWFTSNSCSFLECTLCCSPEPVLFLLHRNDAISISSFIWNKNIMHMLWYHVSACRLYKNNRLFALSSYGSGAFH